VIAMAAEERFAFWAIMLATALIVALGLFIA